MFMTTVVLAALAAGQPDPCRSCHEVQHRAWQTSRHAQASTGVLVQRMREWALADAGEAVAGTCANCHSVALADGSARSAAVTCEACHQSRGGDAAGLVIDPALPVRARRAATDAPHPVAVDETLGSDALCLICHGELRNPAGVPLCTTGPEHAAAAQRQPCGACHAPGADHSFAGTTEAMLARAATLELAVEGERVVVKVANRGTGHALPTGSALREVMLEVSFQDEGGRPLWSNAADGEARFSRVLRDAEGNAPVPAWRAAAVHRDTRLAAGAERVFAYPIPSGASSVEARLVYRRAPPGVAARLGLAAEPCLEPKTMAVATRTLNAPPTQGADGGLTGRTGS